MTDESDYQRLRRAHEMFRKNPVGALPEFKALAEAGSIRAMTQLGYMLKKGVGVQSDWSEAITWFERAYQRGDRLAGIRLGRILFELKRYDEAQSVLARGAQCDDPPFMYWLARVHLARQELGLGRDLLDRATSAGFLWAESLLGHLLLKGKFGRRHFALGLWHINRAGALAIVEMLVHRDSPRLWPL